MSENEQASETFTGDGSEDDFVLTGNVLRILSVTVNGTATDAYTYTAATQTITFTSAPADDAAIKVTYLVDQHPSA
jgi:aminopeptidase N